MRYVQYYTKGAISGKLIEACSDRGIVILDQRNNIETSKQDAIRFNGCRRPVYSAYAVFQGRNILDSKRITEIIEL